MISLRTEPVLPAPYVSGPYTVRTDWIDGNNHLNLAYYVLLFDMATDALWNQIGLGDGLRAIGFGTFAVESHILYRAELLASETITIASQLLAADAKRLHIAHEMRRERDGMVSAQQELIYLSVDLGARRVAPWPSHVAAGLQAALGAHRALRLPDWVGRRLAMPMPAAPSPTAATPVSPA